MAPSEGGGPGSYLAHLRRETARPEGELRLIERMQRWAPGHGMLANPSARPFYPNTHAGQALKLLDTYGHAGAVEHIRGYEGRYWYAVRVQLVYCLLSEDEVYRIPLTAVYALAEAWGIRIMAVVTG